MNGVNGRKTAGPDQISGRVLRSCANQLVPVFTKIFNTPWPKPSFHPALSGPLLSWSLKTTVHHACLNDCRPVALTSVVMKCFERLVKNYICSSLPSAFDPLQFVYKANWCRDDTISDLPHTSLAHLDEGRGNYVTMLFIDYSSAFEYHSPPPPDSQDEVVGLQNPFLQSGSRLPHRPSPRCEGGWWRYLKIPDPQHRRPPGVCPEPVALQHLYTRLNIHH